MTAYPNKQPMRRQPFLTSLVSNLPGMAYRCRNDERLTTEFASDGCLALTGYSPSDLIGDARTSYSDLVHPDDRDGVRSQVRESLGRREPFQVTYRITTASGEEKWVWDQGRGIFSIDGILIAVEGFVCDISDHKKIEEELKKSEAHYRLLAENISDVIFTTDLSFHPTYVSPSVTKLRGVTVEESLSQTAAEIMTPSSLVRAVSTLKEALSKVSKEDPRQYRIIEIELKHKNSSTLWAEMRTSFLHDESGRPNGVLGIYRDISERKTAEDALARRLAYEKMLARISRKALRADDMDKFQKECLRIMGQTLGVSRAYIYGYDEHTQSSTMKHEWTSRGITKRKKVLLRAEDVPFCYPLARQGRVICTPDIESIPSEVDKATLRQMDVLSLLVVPLVIGGAFKGFLGFTECRRHRQWPDEDVELIRAATHIIRDLLERKRAEAESRMQISAINAASDQIIITNPAGMIEYVNPAFEKESGYAREEVTGTSPDNPMPDGRNDGLYRILRQAARSGGVYQGEINTIRKDGSYCIEDVTIAPVEDESGAIEHLIAIKRNVTEKKTYEQQLDHLAHHDGLTGLPNRLLFSDRLTQELARTRRDKRMLAVMFLDLDRFKIINDTLGHKAGDLLLKQVAARLSSRLRGVDTIARMGGDEFTLLLTGIHRAEDATLVAQRALDAFSEPFTLEGRELFITTSIGISLYPSDGNSVEVLVRNADTAMYRAKEQGKNTYHLFTESLNTQIFERMEMEHSLRKAVDRHEFILLYQPRIDIRTGMIVGAEALVRWQHPKLGLILPGQFIPLAEETGLITPLSQWVLRAACAQNRDWQKMGLPLGDVAVNISARQFERDDMVETVRKVLKEAGLPPECLNLELTETTLMNRPDVASETLKALKAMGVRISIDDFGTGFSSLSYLKRFQADAVKIDHSFIRGVTMNPDDAAIAGAVIAMAHSLRLKVIAEGVETLEQLDFLKSLNCDEMQGYLISQPVAVDALTDLLWEQVRSTKLPLSA